MKTILYADVLASAVQNLDKIPPTVAGALKAYLECREINGHQRKPDWIQDGIQHKNGVN